MEASTFTVAVIDMGSNSFRLQISIVADGVYKVIDDFKEVLRIGDIVYKEGGFTPEATAKILNTLKGMRSIIEKTKVKSCRVVGTAPFRDADNTKELIEKVKNETDFDIEVISGEEEARLIYLAATSFFDLNGTNTLFVDIGGGSTELSFSSGGRLVSSVSTPLGCGRLTQKFISKNKAKAEEVSKMRKFIDQELKGALQADKVDKIVFTGGTTNSLAQIYARRSNMSDSVVKYVDATFLNHLVNELASKSYEDRAKIPGLEPERADIALAAAMVVQSLVSQYKIDGFFTFSGGLRNGLTIDLLNRMGVKLLFQKQDGYDMRYTKLMETGRKYNYEEEHALQVTKLSKMLFDGLKKEFKLKDNDWELLEAASLLHDIGQHISYLDHQKHSHYLIKNTELVDYNDEQKNIISLIARYHRRSIPKPKHLEYHELPASAKNKVDKLAGILRIADGLDRSHMNAVEKLAAIVEPKEIIINISADKDLSAEIIGANKKKDLLEKVTGKKVTVSHEK